MWLVVFPPPNDNFAHYANGQPVNQRQVVKSISIKASKVARWKMGFSAEGKKVLHRYGAYLLYSCASPIYHGWLAAGNAAELEAKLP
jgi:hypothetical protein